MNPKWMFFLLVLFMLGSTIFGIAEQTYIGAQEQTVLEKLTFQEVDINIVTIVPAVFNWFGAVGDVITWDYAVFKVPNTDPVEYNDWNILRYLLLWPLSAALLFTIIIAIWQGGIL